MLHQQLNKREKEAPLHYEFSRSEHRERSGYTFLPMQEEPLHFFSFRVSPRSVVPGIPV
jgi:hypothetical protein